VLLAVILSVAQGADASTPQVTDGLPTQFAQEDSSAGDLLSAVGVLFALLPTILGTLWLLPIAAHRAGAHSRPLFVLIIYPAKRRILGVGDAGFEPATSAV